MGECYKRLMNDRLYMAPLSAKKPPRNILDIATGVGDWAIQMGDLFPDSTVLAQTYLQFSQRMCLRTSTSMSKIPILGANLKEIYERVGFVDVHQCILKMPINGWASDPRLKQVGWMWVRNMLDGLSGFSYQLLNKTFERTSTKIEFAYKFIYRHL
ncbi:hypothetical protein IWW34DRAFT_838126 [Fusarium oxysporum f. sp. albedinis]|nr:hypothetical protein IWW34DRAFT_838126 [Fusarium oxysporum f. sp. albedinis]